MRQVLSILIWFFWTIFFLVFFVIVFVLFVLTLPIDKYKQTPNKALKGLAWCLIKIIPGWKVVLKGADISKIIKPTIVVANHQSFLDLPLLYFLPWTMKWVAKKGLFRIPILGWIIYMTGHLSIDRQSRRSVRKLDELVKPIQKGIPGMIFPEGTRTLNGELRPFKNGAFKLAERYNFQVLPVVLDGGFEAMKPGTWQFNFRQTFVVSVLEPLEPGDFESVEDLKNEAYGQIYMELKTIRGQTDMAWH